jgi:hypothetical protein
MSTIYGDGFIADRYLSRNLRLDEAKAQADDVAAARPAVAAIKAIAAIDLTPAVCAQIVAAIRNRTGDASWSHFASVDDALAYLDDAHDTLKAVTL